VGSGAARLTGKTVSGAVTLLRRSPDEDPWDLGVEDRRPDADEVRDTVPNDAVPDNAVPNNDTAPNNAAPNNEAADNTVPDTDVNGENSEDAR
jgi:hypothetical protein